MSLPPVIAEAPPAGPAAGAQARMLERERIANRPKHWVRLVTACNSKCLFCLDADTPRNVYLPEDEIQAELRRGIEQLGADKVILSGGEASLHPAFPALIRYAKSIGYDRVQTVTNGWRYADLDFYKEVMAAGLGEITFSLHGHTAVLHDHLTQHPGSFSRLMKAMVRALRDPRGPIVNMDVVINKQNVAVLDKVIELAISVGVTEFDLLHVIPQANAYDNRDTMFYDVKDHLPVLHKVFALNRHPRFVVWTNRFPVEFLEGMEDLIQDPHKMLDEVNGRRFMVRNYLDTGRPLDCRQPERCVHCFIEPFCATMDRTIARQRSGGFSVWQPADPADPADPLPDPLPFGCDTVGLRAEGWATLPPLRLPAGAGLELQLDQPTPLPAALPAPFVRLIIDAPEALDALIGPEAPPLPAGLHLEVRLRRATAAWCLAQPAALAAAVAALGPRLRLHQPSFEHMAEATASDVRDPAAFFTALSALGVPPLPVSGLPACLAPGQRLSAAIPRLAAADFEPETGRLDIRGLARAHVSTQYRSKSVRCRDCVVNDRCEGVHINMVRDQGLKLCRPLTAGPWADDVQAQLQAALPSPPRRPRDGAPPEAPAPSLPGFAPVGPVTDPLAAVAEAQRARREERARARAAGAPLPPLNPFGPRAG